MGFSTLVTPTHCSEVLQGWIGELTEADREKLSLWGILLRLLKAADVEVSRHLVCTAGLETANWTLHGELREETG